MQDIARILISALIAAFIVPFVLSKLSCGDKGSRMEGDSFVVEYSKAMIVTMHLCTAAFLAFAALAMRFPGRTDPAQLPFAIGTFLFFAAMGMYTSWMMHCSRVYWDQTRLSGIDALGRRHSFEWSELSGIDDVQWAQSIRLRAGRKSVWISPLMRGYPDCLNRLAVEAQRLGIALLEAPEQKDDPHDQN